MALKACQPPDPKSKHHRSIQSHPKYMGYLHTIEEVLHAFEISLEARFPGWQWIAHGLFDADCVQSKRWLLTRHNCKGPCLELIILLTPPLAETTKMSSTRTTFYKACQKCEKKGNEDEMSKKKAEPDEWPFCFKDQNRLK